jgi:hypothetical protein
MVLKLIIYLKKYVNNFNIINGKLILNKYIKDQYIVH